MGMGFRITKKRKKSKTSRKAIKPSLPTTSNGVKGKDRLRPLLGGFTSCNNFLLTSVDAAGHGNNSTLYGFIKCGYRYSRAKARVGKPGILVRIPPFVSAWMALVR